MRNPSDNLPPGISDRDPDAPWNEVDGECRMCGEKCEGDLCQVCHANMIADQDGYDEV